ncbi:MAG: DUF1887 family protein, partial [Deltaproteobacteria bacterium]|nr:DUF1887 family protein [Deltaproteobacteria bacterium]
MRTHVCLVSQQLIPNVLPALIERPDTIVLLTSQPMEGQAELLKNFLQPRGFSCQSIPIGDGYDFTQTQKACDDAIDCYGKEDGEVVLNVTGGTKIAALAAYQQFYFASRRILYMDTDHDRILELGDHPKNTPLTENLLDVKGYLACYGKNIRHETTARRGEREARRDRETTSRICELFIGNPDLLQSMNRQISQEWEKKRKYPLFVNTGGRKEGTHLLELLAGTGIAEASSSERLCIKTEENHFYLNGGWLEEYVYNTVTGMKNDGLDCDCHLNVNIEWDSPLAPGKRTANELDVLFTFRNRLHLISCKTSILDKESGKGMGALYELDSLKDNAGGIFARPMLVSAHPLREADIRRAKELKITVIKGGEILRLR